MRRYEQRADAELSQVVCNKCGRKLIVERGILKEGVFHGRDVFGYFSRKDGESHEFDLCEDCYDELTAQFAIPVKKSIGTELL